jgi:hypothetical protein
MDEGERNFARHTRLACLLVITLAIMCVAMDRLEATLVPSMSGRSIHSVASTTHPAPKMRVEVVMLDDRPLNSHSEVEWPLHAQSAVLNMMYAKQHNYTFWYGLASAAWHGNGKKLASGWCKVSFLASRLETLRQAGHENEGWILYLDADAFMRAQAMNLPSLLASYEDADDIDVIIAREESPAPGVLIYPQKVNTGVLLVRTSSRALRFLHKWHASLATPLCRDLGQKSNGSWAEQTCLERLLPDRSARVRIVPMQYLNSRWSRFARHFFGAAFANQFRSNFGAAWPDETARNNAFADELRTHGVWTAAQFEILRNEAASRSVPMRCPSVRTPLQAWHGGDWNDLRLRRTPQLRPKPRQNSSSDTAVDLPTRVSRRVPPRRAWAALLCGSSRNNTAMLLAQIMSIRRLSPHYPHLTLVTPDVALEEQAKLRAAGSTLIEVDPIELPVLVTRSHAFSEGSAMRSVWRHFFTRLNLWNLTAFDQVASLDIDAQLSVDMHSNAELFNMCNAALCAVPDAQQNPIFGFDQLNAGVLVVRPSAKTFGRLLRELASFPFRADTMIPDQEFLSAFFGAQVPQSGGHRRSPYHRTHMDSPGVSWLPFEYNFGCTQPEDYVPTGIKVLHLCGSGVFKTISKDLCDDEGDCWPPLRAAQRLFLRVNPCMRHARVADRETACRMAGSECHWCGQGIGCWPAADACHENSTATRGALHRMAIGQAALSAVQEQEQGTGAAGSAETNATSAQLRKVCQIIQFGGQLEHPWCKAQGMRLGLGRGHS